MRQKIKLTFLPTCLILLFTIIKPIATFCSMQEPDIKSSSAVLMDAETGMVIYEKNKDVKNYPASITKVMTALLTLENNTDLEKRVHFSRNAVFSIPYNSSHIAMNDGETLTVNDALLGLLLESANEVANALAEDASGNTESFAELMTERASELGALNTNFMNANGLHDVEHYTTAYDMALIMREAVKHDEFVKYINTRSYFIPPTEKQPLKRPLNNSNKMIIKSSSFYDDDVVGGKTGYTDEARHTLVTYASRGDKTLIVTILRGEKNEPYIDTTTLLNYGFGAYEDIKLLDKSMYTKTVKLYGNENEDLGILELIPQNDISKVLPHGIENLITLNPVIVHGLTPPISAGEILGSLQILYNGIILGETPLLTTNAIELPTPKSTKKEPSGKISSLSKVNLNIPTLIFICIIVSSVFCVLASGVVLLRIRRRRFKRRNRFKYPKTLS